MAKRLTSHVHVADEDGNTHVFGPDDKLPAWASKAITNKAAYEEDDEPDEAPIVKSPKGTAPTA